MVLYAHGRLRSRQKIVAGNGAGASAQRGKSYYDDIPQLPLVDISSDIYKTDYMVFRYIAAKGVPWHMGSKTERYRDASRETCQTLTLKHDFCMAVYELTQGQWAHFFDRNPSAIAGATRPVEMVSYYWLRESDGNTPNEAARYPLPPGENFLLGKLNKLTGLSFDLPSEAKWEYACRSGTEEGYWNDGSAIDANEANVKLVAKYADRPRGSCKSLWGFSRPSKENERIVPQLNRQVSPESVCSEIPASVLQYPPMKRMKINEVLQAAPGQSIVAAGWVRTRREAKTLSFLEVNDGSCTASLQVVADASLPDYDSLKRVHPGASVLVEGELKTSQGAGQGVELLATRIQILGLSDPLAYPLGKQRIGFERLRELPHLRARTNSFGAVARVRSRLAFAVHEFFQSRGFLYVHTPILTASDCEGAGEMFSVQASVPGFFGADKHASLTVSGQLEGETYACALGDIYTFGPTFRAENSNTRRHLSEFWMIEPEMAFADLQDDALLAEDFLRHLFRDTLQHCPDELAFFDKRVLPGAISRLERLAEAPFTRLPYTEAIEILRKAKATFEHEPRWGADLQSEHERFLTEQAIGGPVIVTDYPKEIKAFYMRRNDDGKTVAAMDVLLPEVGEIIGGSQREERLDVLEATIRAAGLDPAAYSDYMDLRRFGTVPHAGFGLGFDRLVQICTGMHNIRDVIPYPRAPGCIR